MELVACAAPRGILEVAPTPGLRKDSPTELWEGFWAEDDRFYARCTRPAGAIEWYRYEELEVAVDRPGSGHGPSATSNTGARRRTRTLLLRHSRNPAQRYLLGVSRPKNR
ncbi:MAG TPA: hypothetical protein VK922_05545 [Gemmatimonadaceae bacterium]|jgi:hypothetical protein|nr:hypothetical protein [Gemmatimonadaceae bacterium]